MNFEGFKQLMHRVAHAWYESAKRNSTCDFDHIQAYLKDDPFTAKQTNDNEEAYEALMDIRLKLYVSWLNHNFPLTFRFFGCRKTPWEKRGEEGCKKGRYFLSEELVPSSLWQS